MAKRTIKYPADDVDLLLKLAKGQDVSNVSDRVTIIGIKDNKKQSLKLLSQLEARDELEFRFRSIVASLVNVCITGRVNTRSSYQRTFLRLFAGAGTPSQKVASMLKRELANYEKEELFSTGQLAALLAVERCETNFVSTIVICFKDLIYKMIKDPNNKQTNEISAYAVTTTDVNKEIAFVIFIDSLTEEEKDIVFDMMDGNWTGVAPESLKTKASHYLIDYSI